MHINNSQFNNNSATNENCGIGGTIYIADSELYVSNTVFTKNIAQGTDEYSIGGGVIYIGYGSKTVINSSLFVDNTAKYGGAIYGWNFKNLTVNNNIFLNHTGTNIIYLWKDNSEFKYDLEFNWFGNNATNYNDLNKKNIVGTNLDELKLDSWLFLKATNTTDQVTLFNTSNITFKLNLYNSTTTDDDKVSDYDNTQLYPINLNITSSKGTVDKKTAQLNETIVYNATEVGKGSVTASIESVSCTIELTNKIPTMITVNNNTLDLKVDGTIQLIPTTTPDGLSVSYKSNKESVVTVDSNGLVKAIGEGTATITVKVGGDGVYAENSTTVKVTVSKIPTKIQVNKDKITLNVTNTINCGASLDPKGAGSLTYKSSNSSVAKVDNNGEITALSQGTATITISFKGNTQYAAATDKTIQINVKLKNSKVTVNNNTLDLKVDDTFQLIPTTTPNELTVTYQSNNESVATVDNNGNITSISEGTTTIIVKVGGDGVYAENSTTVSVTVSKIPTEINIEKTTINLTVDDKYNIIVTTTPKNLPVTYTTTDTNLILLSMDGNITALDVGTAYINVSVGGDRVYKYTQINLTINIAKKEFKTLITELHIDEVLFSGKNATITGQLIANGTGLSKQEITLQLSNVTDYEKHYATTDNDGKFNITIQPYVLGNVNLTAIYNGNTTNKYIYNKTNTTTTTKIDKIYYNITTDPLQPSYDYNSTVTISGKVTTNYKQLEVNNVTITINKTSVIVPIQKDNTFAYNFTSDIGGLYNVLINCSGYTNTTTFRIKYPTKFTINVTNSTTDQATIITVNEENKFTGTVNLTIDNIVIGTVSLIDGTGTNNIVIAKSGTHTITINYPGNIEYNATTATSNEFLILNKTSFAYLNQQIQNATTNNLTLTNDYKYDPNTDQELKDGIPISNEFTIYGNGYTIDGDGQARIFNVKSNGDLTIENLTLCNGIGQDELGDNGISNVGGAIYGDIGSQISIKYSNFTENTATKYGGAIFTEDNSTLTIINTTFTNNTVKGNNSVGGAITADTSNVSIINAIFNNNNASLAAGAIYSNLQINISQSLFNNNNAEIGGAIYVIYSNMNITNSKFTNNNATSGGAIATYNSTININNTPFDNNTAINKGGAIYTLNNDLNITNSVLQYNNASNGSGIYIVNGTLNTVNTKFINNTVNGENYNIKHKDSKLTIETIPDTTEGNPLTIKVSADSLFNDNVTLNINGNNYVVEIINGLGQINIPDLKPGTYTAKLIFKGNDNYTEMNVTSNSFKVNTKPVDPTPSNPTVNPSKTAYKVKIYLTLKKVKKVSKNVKKLYLKVTVKLKSKKITTKKITLKVKRNTVKNKKSKKTSGKSKKITKVQNYKFNIKINNKTYTKKTNKKGKATYTITNIYQKGIYTAKITYQSKKYTKNNAKIKFKIKK